MDEEAKDPVVEWVWAHFGLTFSTLAIIGALIGWSIAAWTGL